MNYYLFSNRYFIKEFAMDKKIPKVHKLIMIVPGGS